MRSILLLSTLLPLSLAQDAAQPTLQFPLIQGSDNIKLYGSVVAADSKATTVAVACPSNTDCGLFPKETLVYGPSTYNIDMSDPHSDFTATIDCSFATPSIVCKETAGGSEANFPGSSTTSYDATDVTNVPIVVTAGADKLKGAGSAVSTAAVSTAASTASGASSNGAPTARSGTSGSVIASPTSAAPTTAKSAAAATGAGLAGGVVGVAAGVFGALLL